MIRKIVDINEEKCTGCGLCADACHEGAIEMIDGKAHLIKDDYCDGFGDCLPECPADAITIIEREAAAYDEAAVEARMAAAKAAKAVKEEPVFRGCPGSRVRVMKREANPAEPNFRLSKAEAPVQQSLLTNWPVQIKLVPPSAPYFNNAKLLIAADCTAYAYARFHEDFVKNHVVLIGCPKLDDVDYTDKLQAIIEHNNIKSVDIVRMEVPCCGGLEYAATQALKRSGKFIPWSVTTIGIDGRILE